MIDFLVFVLGWMFCGLITVVIVLLVSGANKDYSNQDLGWIGFAWPICLTFTLIAIIWACYVALLAWVRDKLSG